MSEKKQVRFKVKKRCQPIDIDERTWAYVNGYTIEIIHRPKIGGPVYHITLGQKFLKQALVTEVYP